jgi:hypothetical protein
MIEYAILHLPLSFYGMVWMLLKISKNTLELASPLSGGAKLPVIIWVFSRIRLPKG